MRKFAVQDATFALLIVWTIGFALDFLGGSELDLRAQMALVPELVWAGEWWRLLTFPLTPPVPTFFMALIFVFFFFLYLTLGRNIEQVMGSWRYNLFLLTVWIGSAGGAMLGHALGTPGLVVDLSPVVTSMLFAFATFFPNYTILFMFVVPLQIKWLALVGAVMIAFFLVRGPMMGDRLAIFGQCLGYLIFCGPYLLGRARIKQRKVQREIKDLVEKKTAFHTCAVCGVTELTDPERRFRMCTECQPPTEYCDQHINDHEHRR